MIVEKGELGLVWMGGMEVGFADVPVMVIQTVYKRFTGVAFLRQGKTD